MLSCQQHPIGRVGRTDDIAEVIELLICTHQDLLQDKILLLMAE